MQGKVKGLFLFVMVTTGIVVFAQVKSSQFIKTEKMKEYILLIRLPLGYGTEQASMVRPAWTALTDQWKADGIFVTSFVFPSDSYVVTSENEVKNEVVLSDGLRVVSNIIIKCSDFEEAVALAKKCPILKQGGTVEVREVQPRP